MFTRFFAALGLCAVLGGCMQGQGALGSASAPKGPPDYVFPGLAQVSEEVPPELNAVAAATARRLLGLSSRSIQRGIGVRNAGLIRPSKDLPLKGYTVAEVQHLGAAASPTDPDDREAIFNLLFVDGYGRDAAVRAVIGYTKARGGVRITRAAWSPVSMPLPHFDTFVVPADQTKLMVRAARSWRGLYDEAVKHAVPRAQLASRIGQGGEFLVISMGKRPIGNGASLTLELADGPKGESVLPDDAVRRIAYPGRYVAMVLPVRIEPGSAVWGRIVHKPGTEASAQARKSVVVDQFQLGGQPSG